MLSKLGLIYRLLADGLRAIPLKSKDKGGVAPPLTLAQSARAPLNWQHHWLFAFQFLDYVTRNVEFYHLAF